MYTSVKETGGAIAAAQELVAARRRSAGQDGGSLAGICDLLPLLVDQVMAEAGVVEPRVAAHAIEEAAGDVSRAVSLVRAWAACLPRIGDSRATIDDLAVARRITPAIREPDGGQFLGASTDYAPRLLDLDRLKSRAAGVPAPNGATSGNGANRGERHGGTGESEPEGDPLPMPAPAATAKARPATPARFGRAAAPLEAEGLIAPPQPRAKSVDRTRNAVVAAAGRGPFLQALARAETGAMTAVAYTAVRGTGDDAPDPTLVELRAGSVPVRLAHPRTQKPFTVGHVAITFAEVVMYRAHDESSGAGSDEGAGEATGEPVDARLTLGVGATVGRLERRAISASLLDARVARAAADPPGTPHPPVDDEEWLTIALDGQEATGFVEHLKLPHHVTFTSDLDRVRAIGQVEGEQEGSDQP